MDKKAFETHIDKIKKSMVDHLTSKGYPNLNDQEIINELKPMWVKLEEEGLILPGMTFKGFEDEAHQQQVLQHMIATFGI